MIRVGLVEFPSNLAKARYMAAGSIADLAPARGAALGRRLPAACPSPSAPRRSSSSASTRSTTCAIRTARCSRTPAVTLLRGYGDCDAKARVFVALCRASGIPAREHSVRPAQDFPHILAEVCVNGQWRRVDPTILNSSIGNIPPAWLAVTNYW